jgi:hypothetical protein
MGARWGWDRVVPAGRQPAAGDGRDRLKLFDAATERQRARQAARRAGDRGWRRDELYTRGRPR